MRSMDVAVTVHQRYKAITWLYGRVLVALVLFGLIETDAAILKYKQMVLDNLFYKIGWGRWRRLSETDRAALVSSM